jgi:prepilin-type N-terminal cleavage/methylation domain-containing protein
VEKSAKLILGKKRSANRSSTLRDESSGSDSNEQTGFTIVELLVVITILVAITTMAVPGFLSSVRRARFEKTVGEIVTVLERARTQALASELDDHQKIPPGGYGVYFDTTDTTPATDQKVVLFVDDWNASSGPGGAGVNINYADEQITGRVLPDGQYTPGSDSELVVIEVNAMPYIQLESLFGTKLQDSSAWAHASDNKVLVIFQPPYADTKVVSCTAIGDCVIDDTVASLSNQLKSFEAEFVAGHLSRTIKFNRATTTPQVFEN